MRKIKVLHLITGLGKGGAERVVYDLCHLNNSIDLEQHVIGISEIDGMMAMFKADGIPVISLQMKRNPASFLHSFIRLNRILKQNNYDLIHTHMTHALIIAALLKLFAFPGKVIFTPHNSYFGRRLREWILFVLKPFRYTDILFSPQQKRYFHKKNYICIANGIVTENNKIKPPKFDVFTFLATGRLEKMKNHIALIEMANLLKKRNASP
jgi:glycosyltransferase involved in cell wall biosynthesis